MRPLRPVPVIVLALLLVAGGLALPLLAAPASAYGERVFASNTVLGTGDPSLVADRDEMVAQSFTATSTYVLLNLTLRIENLWNNQNSATVTVRTDDPVNHVPSSTVLASQTIVEPPVALGNYSIPLSPSVTLYAGQVYWIVLYNGAQQEANGYAWHYTDHDAYPGGHAEMYNATTAGWVAYLSYDMFFVVTGRELSANLSLGMAVDLPQPLPQESVNFTVYVNNTGSQVAPLAWVNETLPGSLTFVSDTASGGTFPSSTPFPSYTFANVTPGLHSFVIATRVNIGVAPGTVSTNWAALAYVNATGARFGGLTASASVTIGLVHKQLYLAPATTPIPATQLLTTTAPTGATPTSSPALGTGASATFALSPGLSRSFVVEDPVARLWFVSQGGKTVGFNLTLLDNGTAVGYGSAVFVNPGTSPREISVTLAVNATFARFHEIQFRVTNDPTTTLDDLILQFNGTSAPSDLDFLTPSYVSVDALVLRNASSAPTYFTPLDTVIVQANVSDPFGSSRVAAAFLNVTGPVGAKLVDAAAMTRVQSDAGPYSAWSLFSYTVGTGLANGTYAVTVRAMEDNGAADLRAASAVVRAPGFASAQTPSVPRAKAGDSISYTLTFNNTGTSPAARVWVNDTFPSQVSYVSSSWNVNGSFVAFTPIPGGYSWSWSSVPEGSTNYLIIDAQIGTGIGQVAWIRNYLNLTFSDANGHVWPVQATVGDIILNGPVIDLSVSSAPTPNVHANETVALTMNLSNSGDGAGVVWLNVTLPAGLHYVTAALPTANGTTAVIGLLVEIRLPDMPGSTNWTVSLTAACDPVVPLGATLLTAVGLNYSSLNGIPMPEKAAQDSLTTVAPFIPSSTLTLGTSQAGPGQVFIATVRFTNLGNEPAADAWVNLTADLEFKFLNATSAASVRYTGVALTLSFPLRDVALGPFQILMNLSVVPQATDGHRSSLSGSIAYDDGFGNVLWPVPVPAASLLVSTPVLALSVTPGLSIVESGTTQAYTVYVFNAGSGTAAEVWLNVSSGATFTYVSDTSGAGRSVLGTDYSWRWTNQTPGPKSFTLTLRAAPSNPDGSTGNLSFHLAYLNPNNMPGAPSNVTVHATFIAPMLRLTLAADRTDASAGSMIGLTLTVTNAGNSTAHWVNVTGGDPRLQVVSYDSKVPATGKDVLAWNYTDLAPGQSQTIKITAQLAANLSARTAITETFHATYSNSRGGTTIGFALSSPLVVTVAVDLMPLLYIGLAGLVAMPLLAYYVSRRVRVQVEEVFLVYRDGVLISHLSRTLLQDKDEDVLTGMLTAVQEFVRDAFQYGAHRELHQMDFGEYRILIERGRLAYLAVVYSGKNAMSIRKKVREVLDRIEDAYGDVLEKWDGDMEKVVGARDMIRDYLLGQNGHPKNHNHVPAE